MAALWSPCAPLPPWPSLSGLLAAGESARGRRGLSPARRAGFGGPPPACRRLPAEAALLAQLPRAQLTDPARPLIAPAKPTGGQKKILVELDDIKST